MSFHQKRRTESTICVCVFPLIISTFYPQTGPLSARMSVRNLGMGLREEGCRVNPTGKLL